MQQGGLLKLTRPQKVALIAVKRANPSALIRERAQAVLTRNEGFTIKQTAVALQKSESFVKDSIRRFKGGMLETTDYASHNYKLSPEQRQEAVAVIKTKTPRDVGFPTQFWTMKIVKNWIKKAYKIEYKDEKSYRELFKEAGFTFHKPKPVDYRQDRGKIKAFKGALKKSSVSSKLTFSW
jgi:transposase